MHVFIDIFCFGGTVRKCERRVTPEAYRRCRMGLRMMKLPQNRQSQPNLSVNFAVAAQALSHQSSTERKPRVATKYFLRPTRRVVQHELLALHAKDQNLILCKNLQIRGFSHEWLSRWRKPWQQMLKAEWISPKCLH